MRGTMRVRPAKVLLAVFVVSVATGIACEPISGTPSLRAPSNECVAHPCENYASGKSAPRCSDVGRCEFQGERPLDYRFTIVVHVPDTSFFAPGQTFVIDGKELDPLAIVGTAPRSQTCSPPLCLSLPSLYDARGVYRVTREAAADVGVNAPDSTAFPSRVLFVPLENETDLSMVDSGLPVGPLFASSSMTLLDPNSGGSPEAVYVRPVPAGHYVRAIYPEPPFDEFLPPSVTTVRTTTGAQTTLPDVFMLGSITTPLDDRTGLLRTAGIKRAEGLEGFSAWLADAVSGVRISSLRRLHGVEAHVRLDTVGQSQAGGAVRDNVDLVIAPPESSLGLPVLRSRLFSGAGLDVAYPSLPVPLPITGVVAASSAVGFRAIPSRISFASTALRTSDDQLQQVLHYETSVFTDDAGGFSTVLPSGLYDVTTEPLEGTGFAKTLTSVDVKAGGSPLQFEPVPITVVTGRAVLSDGRPLSNTTIVATPATSAALRPRPSTTRTDANGQFTFELDRGTYDVAVLPENGTGFPRIVVEKIVNGASVDFGTLTVPVPTRLSFTVGDPSQTSNPIVRAVVRIFARSTSTESAVRYVEMGSGMTDPDGRCEILLAQGPP